MGATAETHLFPLEVGQHALDLLLGRFVDTHREALVLLICNVGGEGRCKGRATRQTFAARQTIRPWLTIDVRLRPLMWSR